MSKGSYFQPRRRRWVVRCAVGALVFAASGIGATISAVAQEVVDEGGEELALPQSYLDGYAWWNKSQQLPTGGQGVPAQSCQPTDTNQCPAGPPVDGLYVVYDYESMAPTAVTGPVGNLPTPPVPPPPPEAPVPNSSAPRILGPTAFGAVRYIVPEGAETELSLTILSKSSTTPGGTDASLGKLFACAVASPGWAAIQNGRYDQAPTYDCSSADEADLSGDQAIFQFPTGMVSSGLLDVVIVGAGDRPFQASFAAPTNESLRIVNAEALAEAFATAEEDIVIEDPLTSFEAGSDVGSFAGDIAYTSDDTLLPSIGPSVGTSRPQAGERAVPARNLVNPFSPDASRGERILAVSLLMAIGTALWWVGGIAPRGPRLLGSLGAGSSDDAPVIGGRGIGRFIRPRSGRAPRLF